MRKLMWFTIGFAAACAICTYLVNGSWVWILALCCLPGIALLWIDSNAAKRAAVCMLGLAVGFGWCFGFNSLYLDQARYCDGQVLKWNVEASDYCQITDYGVQGEGYVRIADKEYPVKYYLSQECDIAPGDWVFGEFKLRLTVSGAENPSLSQNADGVHLMLTAQDEVVVQKASETPLRYYPAVARRQIAQQIVELLPDDAAGFAQSLVLGDNSHVTEKQLSDMKISGICHVIAASGLHVAILLSLVYFVTGESSRWTAFLGVPVLLGFAALVGFTPSVVRACIMQGLMLFSFTVNKEHDPPTALSFAVLVMLLCNPGTVASVSLQLSVSCIIGIMLFSKRISNYLLQQKRLGTGKGKTLKARATRYLAASLSVSISTAITTTPLCAVYFGTVSLVGILTNFLTLWVISFIFYGILLALVAGAIWMPLGQVIAWVVAWPIRYVLAVAGLLAEFPFAAVYTQSEFVVCWIVLCYVLLSAFWLCKKKRPLLLCTGVIIGLILAVGASCIEPMLDRYRITMLDVGQGQCILVQSGDKNYMIDCGGEYATSASDTAVHKLYSQGITQLDGLILTHFDSDHVNGVELLLSRMKVDKIYLPYAPEEESRYKQQLLQQEMNMQTVHTQAQIEDGAIRMLLVRIATGNSDNKTGLCVLCQVEDCDILITGDLNTTAEKVLLEQLTLPKLDVLVVGHHGSPDATSLQLLQQTRPQYAMVSVGRDNLFGHPSETVLKKLTMFDVTLRRTDRDGTILIRG